MTKFILFTLFITLVVGSNSTLSAALKRKFSETEGTIVSQGNEKKARLTYDIQAPERTVDVCLCLYDFYISNVPVSILEQSQPLSNLLSNPAYSSIYFDNISPVAMHTMIMYMQILRDNFPNGTGDESPTHLRMVLKNANSELFYWLASEHGESELAELQQAMTILQVPLALYTFE